MKVKIKNVKTGKVSEVTSAAYEILCKSGRKKEFDLIEGPKVVEGVSTNVQNNSEADSTSTDASIPEVDKNEDGKRSAEEMIKAIKEAESLEAVNVLIDGESRSTVLKAAQKRKAELNN
jgi:hypothetical protein